MIKKILFSFVMLGLLITVLPNVSAVSDGVNPENFNTVDNSYYQGINVGWDIEVVGLQNDQSYLEGIKVNLYSESTLLATNTANLSKMQDLANQGIKTYSTPFIINNKTYPEDEYWDFEWKVIPTEDTKPTRAEIIYDYSPARENQWAYAPGKEQVIVENTNLVEPNGNTWDSLEIDEDYISNLLPEEETQTSGGGGINVSQRTKDTYGEAVAYQMFDLIRDYQSHDRETKFFYWKNQNRLDFVEKTNEDTWMPIASFDINKGENNE